MKRFPYGAAACVLLLLALLSGGFLLANPVKKPEGTLTFWTFAKPHYEAYLKAIPEFERTHPGVKINIQLVAGEAVSRRLRAAFWADLDVPDLVETEISTAGTFFRGSVKNVGFVDLTDRIEREGWDKKMVASRFSPYTTRGRIFGLPHDVHPVQLAYRRDIFEKEGIDVSKIETWDDFIKIGQRVTKPGKQYLIELSDSNSGNFETLLFQRDGGFFDADGECIFDNETGVETMLFYVPLVAGPKRIANSLGGFGAQTNRAIEDGYLMSLLAPDWRTKGIENDVAAVKGKMALMPLPAIKPGGRRTSTWGGTMMGITKACKNQELAWEFAKFLYTSDRDLAARFSETNIIPPVRSAWNLPEFKKPNPFYSNQALGTTFAKLAPETPAQYGSPFIDLAKGKAGEAVVACVAYYNQKGEAGFEQFVRTTLKQKADEVRRVMERSPDFDVQQKATAGNAGAGTAEGAK